MNENQRDGQGAVVPRGRKVPVRIQFGGAVLEGAVVGDKNFVAMKPIVEGLGLDWGKQLAVMKADPVLKDELCTLRGIVAEDGKRREMVCLPEDRLQGWLFKINANRVKAASRDKLIAYQREAYRVLHEAFVAGRAETAMRVRAIAEKREAACLMSGVVQDVRAELGKKTGPHHFINEHELVNFALLGRYEAAPERALSADDLSLQALLRRKNATMYAMSKSRDERRDALVRLASEWRAKRGGALPAAA